MSIRKILVPVGGSDADSTVLEAALVVARRFGAHIDVLHVLERFGQSQPYVFDRVPARLKNAAATDVDDKARRRADEVRQQFEQFCERSKLAIAETPAVQENATARWCQHHGQIAEVLVHQARLSDVIAIARPRVHAATVRRSPVGENLEAVLLDAGRPVLIVPPDWAVKKVEHAVIGWNESLQASRAVAVTIPWLIQMSAVTVLVSRQREPRVAALLDYLAWHGIEGRVKVLSDKADSVGESIVEASSEVGADFLVVGGYSHTRTRELLFGGVTRYLLQRSDMITVMVH